MITVSQYQFLQDLYNYYNKALFQGKLPDCLINICRRKGGPGFFVSERWTGTRWERIHEINLTPRDLEQESLIWHAVLVHNTVHLWQYIYGGPSRNGYHNTEFALKMEETGLITLETGKPDGKRTGQKVSQNINPAGAFIKAFNNLQKKNLEYQPLPDLESTESGKKAKDETYISGRLLKAAKEILPLYREKIKQQFLKKVKEIQKRRESGKPSELL